MRENLEAEIIALMRRHEGRLGGDLSPKQIELITNDSENEPENTEPFNHERFREAAKRTLRNMPPEWLFDE